jgi:hypothetical protein
MIQEFLPASADRVRSSTPDHINREIDRRIDSDIEFYAQLDTPAIRRRLEALDREWDVERVLEVNASSLALTGLLLGAKVHRNWFFLTGGVLVFLLQHGLQGWCPPLPVLRRRGVRTRGEIDREKFALVAELNRREAAIPNDKEA